MRSFLRGILFFVVFFFAVSLQAQQKFGPVNLQLADHVEEFDTAGFSKNIPVYFASHTTKNEETLLAHIIATQYYSIAGKYSFAAEHIRAFRQIDSLLRDDSLKGMQDYAEGLYYFTKEDYLIALPFLNKASLAFHNTAATLTQARCFSIRGLIYNTLMDQEASEKCYLIALKFYHSSHNIKREGMVLNNLGITKTNMRDSAGAMKYLLRSYAIRDSLNDNFGRGQANNNLGALMYEFKHYTEALDYYSKGFEYRKKADTPLVGLIESRINIGKTLHKLGRDNEAVVILEAAFKDTPEERLELKRRACRELMEIYTARNDFKNAFAMQTLYYFAKDSLYGLSKKEEIVKLNAKYDFDNMRQQDSLRHKIKEDLDKAISNEKEKRNTLVMLILFAGLAVAGIFVFFLYRSNSENKKKNQVISAQRDILDKKQQEITESIQYAHYIQEALLPADDSLRKNLPEHFILYRPKDIVSGDFYWHAVIPGGEQLLAVADCTGHGVPGAFMSLLGKESLDKAKTISTSPGKILSELNRHVKNSLKQNDSGKSTRDGMDIALIKLAAGRIIYSGANRPLWIFRTDGTQEEIRATKTAIGGFTPDAQEFGEHEIITAPGEMIYLFTDGYADQFGGARQKKLTTKKFRELLSGIQSLPVNDQKIRLENYFDEWKSGIEQVDDILVIGIRC